MAASVNSTIQEGIADYRQKDYEQAESNFSKAQKEQPDNPELNYNLANSRYKIGKYQEALQAYTHATAGDTRPELKQKSLYNTGNALFRMGKLEEAETAYKKALEMDSKDMDAKFNLEFVREQIKKKNQEQPKQNQGSNSEDNQNQEQNSSPENNNESEQRNSSNQEDQKSSSAGETKRNGVPSPAEQQESQTSNPVQAQDNSISKDQADHWLSALNEDLKKFRQKQAWKENPGSPNQSKDW